MRVWKVVVLVNLALAVGVGWGYVWWGRQAERLARELAEVRVAAVAAGPRDYAVRGVVRAVLPELGVLVIAHEEIPGYMPPMTMGFRVASAEVRDQVAIGDEVRFRLQGTLPSLVITEIERVEP